MTAAGAILPRALIDAASAPYQAAGRFAYHFARGKLKADPIFQAILSHGLLARRQHILDLGCGQGLLAAWLAAARRLWRPGAWPQGWPEPPQPTTFRGIELVDRYAERARIAVGDQAEVIRADVRSADFGHADAIVLLDVLQYIAYGDQVRILERARRALAADGVLLLRIGNAAGGLKFTWATWVDRMVLLGSGRGLAPLNCRSTAGWQELLARLGFDSETQSMSAGTPFANVLIVARPRRSPGP